MRQNMSTVVIGTNGTGKSTLCEKILLESGKRCLIVDHAGKAKIWHKYDYLDIAQKSEIENWNNVRRIPYTGYKEETFELIFNNIEKGIVLFDDCRHYIKSNMDHQPMLEKLMIDYRHLELDLFFVVHSVNHLPPRAWSNVTHSIIGSSPALISGERMAQLGDATKFLNLQKKINTEYQKKYKPSGKDHYGIFQVLKH